MKQKIAVLIGSPRKGGNTEMLAHAFINGIDRQKYDIEIISVTNVRVEGCRGCNACYADSGHRCVINDDMQGIYKKLKDTKTIVIATPIYFYGVSAQLKCIFDRLYNPIRGEFKVSRLALLMVCADTIPEVFDSVIAMYKLVLSYFSLEDAGIIRVNGVEKKGDIAGNPALIEAFELAKRMTQ